MIGSALAGAFVLGAVFEHLRPWQRKADEASLVAAMKEHVARAAIPRMLARCIAAGIAVPEVSSDPYDKDGDRRSYVMACMRGEGFEYTSLLRCWVEQTATLTATTRATEMSAATGRCYHESPRTPTS